MLSSKKSYSSSASLKEYSFLGIAPTSSLMFFHFTCDLFTSRGVLPRSLVFHSKCPNDCIELFHLCWRIPMVPILRLLGPPNGSYLILLNICNYLLCNLPPWCGRTYKYFFSSMQRGRFPLLKAESSSSYLIWWCTSFKRDNNPCGDSSFTIYIFLLLLPIELEIDHWL